MPGSNSDGADIAHELAAAFLAGCATAGLRPPSSLRLLAAGSPAGVGRISAAHPGDLGTAHESLTTAAEQTRRGAWYTPASLAADLVARTVVDVGTVVDPSCGGGVFLLAAADRLLALGADPAEIVGELLVGIDVDPLAVAVAEAALWWWGAEHGVDVVPSGLTVGDALVDGPLPPCRAMVGNPPFLGQLRATTTVDGDYRTRLRERFGDAVGPYTDPAALFLLVAVDALEPGGQATLIQPQSVLATRDTNRLRSRVDAVAELEHCWFDDGSTFAAAVEVCAPTLRRRSGHDAVTTTDNQWAGALADHRGIPPVDLVIAGRLGDLASVRAGFRDEYYGLVDAVIEGGPGPRLVTSGAIDPFTLRTDRPTRFAKRNWDDPRIDVDRATDRARGWITAQLSPSVLVASQTRIIECVPDPVGDLVIGVPGLAVVPTDPDDLLRVTAAVSAPCVSAWLHRRTVGTGLSGDACRPTAPLLTDLPLPADRAAWDAAAELARQLATTSDPRPEQWRAFGRAADAAYGVDDPDVLDWWDRRRPGGHS